MQHNLSVYRSCIPSSLNIMAVVKADAYGHGEQVIAKYLSDNRVRHFVVSNIDEAIHIHEAEAKVMILILGYTPVERAEDLIRYDITQTILSEYYSDRLASQADDLLSSIYAHVGWDKGDSDHLHTDGPAQVRRVAG